ncbi:M55 family metallopeptidase [Sulfobacillus harzensis]|uniref:M55 family metallopeptidase n=1 Tax=Sulfobacillus harzensis TaxID=2729629 RepID=A0A7Y0L4U7_9FIRM|nr:M55 family metallopeptidase [Sulfobacillus harzensis]NMP23348.1 M55 family metallopeptidase [Sulfobacillus harzensis]
MRILISVDMEGIAGVTGRDDVTPGNVNYERFRHQMTYEANAAIEGAYAAGATSVVVNDSHGSMRNLLYEELDPRAELISGHNKLLGMVEGAQDADAALFIGYHAKAGALHAVMDHTISGAQIHNWRLNGLEVSEAEINAALLGHFGVPVLLTTGDDRLARDLAERLPGVVTVVVKFALDHRVARNLPRTQVFEAIRSQSREAVSRHEAAPIFRVPGPVQFQIEFTRSFYAEAASILPVVQRVDGRTIAVEGQDVLEAWRWAYGALKIASSGDS